MPAPATDGSGFDAERDAAPLDGDAPRAPVESQLLAAAAPALDRSPPVRAGPTLAGEEEWQFRSLLKLWRKAEIEDLGEKGSWFFWNKQVFDLLHAHFVAIGELACARARGSLARRARSQRARPNTRPEHASRARAAGIYFEYCKKGGSAAKSATEGYTMSQREWVGFCKDTKAPTPITEINDVFRRVDRAEKADKAKDPKAKADKQSARRRHPPRR